MNNSNKKKNRVPSSAGRPVRSRAGPDRLAVSPEGVYCNASFMQAITLHIGDKVTVYTVHGKQFEGYLKTFSKTFELVISMTHQVDPERPQHIDPSTVVDMKIFKLDDIVRIEAKNVDLEYAIRDTFATDTAISKFNGVIGEKELEPWTEDSMLVGGPGGDNDFDLDQMCNHNNTGTATNGWDVNDMFKKNETVYGVQSTFDQSLSGYTVQIQKRDTAEFKEAEARAAAIANEIENNPTYRARVELENGDEEDRFAAVTRLPADPGAAPPPAENGKYVPPAKRNHQQGKLMPRTMSSSTTSTSTSSGPPTPTQTSLPSPQGGTPTPPLSRQDSTTQSPPTPTPANPPHPQQHTHSHPQSDRQSTSHPHPQPHPQSDSRHHHDRHPHSQQQQQQHVSHHDRHSYHNHSNSNDRHHTHSNHSSLDREHQHHRQQDQRQQHGERQERQERHNVERQDSRHSDRHGDRQDRHTDRQHNDNRQQQGAKYHSGGPPLSQQQQQHQPAYHQHHSQHHTPPFPPPNINYSTGPPPNGPHQGPNPGPGPRDRLNGDKLPPQHRIPPSQGGPMRNGGARGPRSTYSESTATPAPPPPRYGQPAPPPEQMQRAHHAPIPHPHPAMMIVPPGTHHIALAP
ncbi:hypothetical protein WDU94_009982, partial [Cyamophila willieti]